MTEKKTGEVTLKEKNQLYGVEISENEIKNLIHEIRGQQVMLDSDLAMLYQVETKNLNKAMKRNIDRFPEDFCFRLTEEEYGYLRFQIGTSKRIAKPVEADADIRHMFIQSIEKLLLIKTLSSIFLRLKYSSPLPS